MSGVRHIEVGADEAGQRLDRWFKRRFPSVTHGRLEKMLRKGEIRVNGARVKAADRVEAGQVVRVPPLPEPDCAEAPPPKPPPQASAAEVEALRARVLYEDGDMIALDKPPGLAVQGGTGQTTHLDALLHAIVPHGAERPKLVHRLDKDTSGVLLLAKTVPAAAALARAFQSRATRKTYWAAVVGAPKQHEGTVKSGLLKTGKPGAEKVVVTGWDDVDATPGAKRAVTDYAVVESLSAAASWLALRPVTGRTHQLRAHMGALRCPIVGDGKYRGDVETAHLGGQFSRKLHLHARSLDIPHPRTGASFSVSARLPEHMARTWAQLGWDEDGPDEDVFAELDERMGR